MAKTSKILHIFFQSFNNTLNILFALLCRTEWCPQFYASTMHISMCIYNTSLTRYTHLGDLIPRHGFNLFPCCAATVNRTCKETANSYKYAKQETYKTGIRARLYANTLPKGETGR